MKANRLKNNILGGYSGRGNIAPTHLLENSFSMNHIQDKARNSVSIFPVLPGEQLCSCGGQAFMHSLV